MIRYRPPVSLSAIIRVAAVLKTLVAPGLAEDGQPAKMEPLAFENKTVELVVETQKARLLAKNHLAAISGY